MFGESEARFTFDVAAAQGLSGRVTWAFFARDRFISRGDRSIRAEVRHPVSWKCHCGLGRCGTGLCSRPMSVAVVDADDQTSVSEFEKRLWIFPPDPFADHRQWLMELKIAVFDPEGDTWRVFGKAKIGYREVRNFAALEAGREAAGHRRSRLAGGPSRLARPASARCGGGIPAGLGPARAGFRCPVRPGTTDHRRRACC